MTQDCKFDVTKLLDTTMPKQTNIFYDMFLEDYNGDLIDIPVYIKNLNNVRNKDVEKSKRVLSRRFFIFETITGVVTGQENEPPKYLRIATSIKLKIRLDEKNPEQIYPPFLEIQYMEIAKSSWETDPFIPVGFTTEYFSDTGDFWYLTKVLYIILLTLWIMIVLCQIGIHWKQ